MVKKIKVAISREGGGREGSQLVNFTGSGLLELITSWTGLFVAGYYASGP